MRGSCKKGSGRSLAPARNDSEDLLESSDEKAERACFPQRHNLVSHFLIHLLRLRILVVLRRINLSKKGRLLLLFKTSSKKRQKADVEDRKLLRMHFDLIMLIQAIQFRVVQRPG